MVLQAMAGLPIALQLCLPLDNWGHTAVVYSKRVGSNMTSISMSSICVVSNMGVFNEKRSKKPQKVKVHAYSTTS
jgi:hypothetical protein